MSSSDSPAGTEPRLVRTTGLRSPRVERTVEDEGSDDAAVAGEVDWLRERVAELEADLERAGAALADREARIEELEAELASVRRERDDAREWATFLDDELREHRERVGTLEDRVEALESRGLLDRLRGLLR
jgi:chromosome segregation protein